MWLVWSNDDGIIITTENKEEAIEEYEKAKQYYKDSFDGEFYGDEHVILAKIEKQFYSYDTKEPVTEEDDEGNEIETGDTYWDWREESC
jgi:hypothetical protein